MNIKCVTTIFVLLVLASPSHAEEVKLWPTMLKSLGDCVTPRISAPANTEQERVNKTYCQESNPEDAERASACIENSRTAEVDFFTDRCGETENVFYISLNGIEYKLQRLSSVPATSVPYAGTYKGEGIDVEVIAGKLLKQEMTYPEENYPAEVISEEHEVSVVVTTEGHTEKIQGIFWQGR